MKTVQAAIASITKLLIKAFYLFMATIKVFLSYCKLPSKETVVYIQTKKIDSKFINDTKNSVLKIESRIRILQYSLEKLSALHNKKVWSKVNKRIQCDPVQETKSIMTDQHIIKRSGDERKNCSDYNKPSISKPLYYEAPGRVRYVSHVRLMSVTPFSFASSKMGSQMSMGDMPVTDSKTFDQPVPTSGDCLGNETKINNCCSQVELFDMEKLNMNLKDIGESKYASVPCERYNKGSELYENLLKENAKLRHVINEVLLQKSIHKKPAINQDSIRRSMSKDTIQEVASLPKDTDNNISCKEEEDNSSSSEDTTINSSTLPTFEVVEYRKNSVEERSRLSNKISCEIHMSEEFPDQMDKDKEISHPPTKSSKSNKFSGQVSRKLSLKNVASSTIPTPPPLPPATANQQSLVTQENLNLKPLHWKPIKLSEKKVIRRSAWYDLQTIQLPTDIIDSTTKRLIELFSNQPTGGQNKFRKMRNRSVSNKLSRSNSSVMENSRRQRIFSKSRSHSEDNKRMAAPKLLNLKRAQNIGIFIVGKHLTAEAVRMSLLDFDETAIPYDSLTLLLELYPSREEIEGIREYSKRNPNVVLDKPEQFVYDLSRIPSFEDRVQCMTTYQEHQELVQSLRTRLHCFQSVCQNLQESEAIWWILALLLKIGNAMNINTPRANAEAFDLEVLVTLKNIKAQDQSCSLLSFLVKEYLHLYPKRNSEILIVHHNLKNCLFDFAEIKLEMDKLDQSIEKCKFSRYNIDKNDPETLKTPILDKLEVFFTNSKKILEDLKLTFDNVVTQYHELLDYFCASKHLKPVEFFTIWITFFSDFRDIYVSELGLNLKSSKRRHQNASNGISEGSSLLYQSSSIPQ